MRCLGWVLLGMLLVLAAVPAKAQDDSAVPQEGAAAALRAIGLAFDQVGDRAASGAWQEADGAFNEALDALDAGRPVLESLAGADAAPALAEADRLVAAMDVALRAEDPTRVRAAVAGIKAALAPLVPGSGPGALSGDAVEIALAWRDALSGIQALGDAGEWIPMRNACLDLHADILARKAFVAAAAGPQGAEAVEALRVFTVLLFVASLDQSPEAAARAAEHYRRAADAVLVALDVLAAPTVTRDAAAADGEGIRIRGFQVEGRPGEVVRMPLVAEGIPQVGLGGFELALRWSPAALRLLDVSWETGQGSFQRDDAAGQAVLRFPQAPTGPSGDAILAQLSLDVLAGEARPEDYLPLAEIEALEADIEAAREAIRRASLPEAAERMALAYMRFVDGRDEPRSLYGILSEVERAPAVTDALIELVDLTSRPSIDSETVVPADLLIQLLASLEQQLASGLELHAARLAPEGGIPVLIEPLAVRDTTGRALSVLEAIPGLVLLPDREAVRLATDAADDAGTTPTVPPQLEQAATALGDAAAGVITGTPASALASDTATTGATSGTADARGGLPMPLVLALALALLAAGLVVFLSGRTSGRDEPAA